MADATGFKQRQPVGKVVGQMAHVGLSLALFIVLSYLLGHSVLSGPLQGNDSPLHVAYAEWLDQYFPSVPHWYPLQGGGESLLHGYPIAPHLLVVTLHRASELSILQVYRLISFFTFPLTALGIYLFAWDAFKRQATGLIAGVFYLLSPVSWTWMYDWGFFAQQVGLTFLPIALLAFRRTLRSQESQPQTGLRRLWLVALSVILIGTALSHMMVAAAAAIGMLLLVGFGVLMQSGPGRRVRLKAGAKTVVLLGAAVAMVLAAYVVPFYLYGNVANREGLNTPPIHQLHRLPIPAFFGLQAIDPLEILTRMQFPMVVSALAVAGLLLAYLRYRRGTENGVGPLVLGAATVLATFFTLTPAAVAVVLRLSPLVFNFVNFRSMLLLVMVLMPGMAAYGAWALASAVARPRAPIGVPRAEQAGTIADFAASSLAPVVALGGALLVWTLTYQGPSSAVYGPLTEGIDFSDPWDRSPEGANDASLAEYMPDRWPIWWVREDDPFIDKSIEIAGLLPASPGLRIDVSPHQGRLAMDLIQYAGASQVNSYTFQISLIHLMWGYQQNVFFSREDPVNEYGSPTTLNSASDWFGIQYAILNPEKDPTEMYQEAGWEEYAEAGGAVIWSNPRPTPLATASTSQAILVIGKPETDSFTTIFRIANSGVLPLEEAWLIEGRSRVDDYSLEQLSLFDGVILYGHDYRDSRKAWELLGDYVAQGGGLFVDTGWEFWVPEWEFEVAPEILPVAKATWTNYGAVSGYSIGDPEIAGQVDSSAFKPLIWEGEPWMLSGAEASDIRDWARPVLSAAGNPLVVAGDYREGRVVWSGMNLIGHARYGDGSTEELELFGNLIRWMARVDEDSPVALADPSVAREYPDQVLLNVPTAPGQTTWLFWREAYYPNWHAHLADSDGMREVPIFRAGPGFMLMPLETQDALATVNLTWELPLAEEIAKAVSVAGMLVLVALAADGLFLHGEGATWVKIALYTRFPRPFLGEGFNEEWAARKRLELRRGHSSDHVGLEPAEAVPWMRGKSKSDSDGTDRASAPDASDPSGSADSPSEEQLLESWLEATGHQDDGWAAKFLENRQSSGEE